METTKFDIQDFLHTEDDVYRYLHEAITTADGEFLQVALADAAQALGVSTDALRIEGDSVQVLRVQQAVEASTGRVIQVQRWEPLEGDRR